MSAPELVDRGYPERLVIGTLVESATLGLLIPPSIILIVYGVATDQSIARLFVAGIIPSIILVAMFDGYVIIQALMNPSSIPAKNDEYTLIEKFRSSRRLSPVLILITDVVGSIYADIASLTDAAALGVIFAIILSFFSGTLSRKMLA